MEKPPSVKSTRRARAVFPEGKFSDAYSQNTLLAHLSELVGKDHAPLPREDHTQPVISGPPTPSSPPIPSFLSRGMWAKRSLGAQAGCSMEHSFAPEQTKTLKFIAFPRIKSNLSLLSLSPCTKNWVCFLSATLNYIP